LLIAHSLTLRSLTNSRVHALTMPQPKPQVVKPKAAVAASASAPNPEQVKALEDRIKSQTQVVQTFKKNKANQAALKKESDKLEDWKRQLEKLKS
jgi:hypothetical protein